jgi:hypothetical protein
MITLVVSEILFSATGRPGPEIGLRGEVAGKPRRGAPHETDRG